MTGKHPRKMKAKPQPESARAPAQHSATDKQRAGHGHAGVIVNESVQAAAPCTISFFLSPGDGEPNFHRAAQLEDSSYLTFVGNTATAIVSAGAHRLKWWAAGDPGEPFALALTGDVEREEHEEGGIPASRLASGLIPFTAVTA